MPAEPYRFRNVRITVPNAPRELCRSIRRQIFERTEESDLRYVRGVCVPNSGSDATMYVYAYHEKHPVTKRWWKKRFGLENAEDIRIENANTVEFDPYAVEGSPHLEFPETAWEHAHGSAPHQGVPEDLFQMRKKARTNGMEHACNASRRQIDLFWYERNRIVDRFSNER